MQYQSKYSSPLGEITIAADNYGITGLWFEGQKNFGSLLISETGHYTTSIQKEAENWLDIYFAGGDCGTLPPLSLKGTPFQKSVWEILLTVPHGEVITYGEIAKRLGKSSPQAIGGAVGKNPVSIIVPCHRVIGSDGSLTGYAGGLDRKRKLLEIEGVDLKKLRK